jgi:hypothetical protein
MIFGSAVQFSAHGAGMLSKPCRKHIHLSHTLSHSSKGKDEDRDVGAGLRYLPWIEHSNPWITWIFL